MTTGRMLSAANEQYINRLSLDLQLRGYSQHTQRVYIQRTREFLGFCGKDASFLDETDARNA